jgi:RimJ/RimL family protein N-acetyltransferase
VIEQNIVREHTEQPTPSKPLIRILRPGDEEALEAFLLPRFDSSMFLVSNLRTAGLRDSGRRFEGTYAAAFDGDTLLGVVAHYWNQYLIVQAPAHVVALARAAAAASWRPVRGLIGPLDQVAALIDALALEPTHMQADDAEYLYSLSLDALIEPEDLRLGRVRGRRIERSDLERTIDWRVAYSGEELGDADTPDFRDGIRASVEASLEAGDFWVLEDAAGTPLAQSGFNAETGEAVQIGGVWTPPALRGRGYGRAVVAASLRDARAEGKTRAILFTGVRNIPAQKAYLALGFRHIGDYRIVVLREAITDITQNEDR